MRARVGVTFRSVLLSWLLVATACIAQSPSHISIMGRCHNVSASSLTFKYCRTYADAAVGRLTTVTVRVRADSSFELYIPVSHAIRCECQIDDCDLLDSFFTLPGDSAILEIDPSVTYGQITYHRISNYSVPIPDDQADNFPGMIVLSDDWTASGPLDSATLDHQIAERYNDILKEYRYDDNLGFTAESVKFRAKVQLGFEILQILSKYASVDSQRMKPLPMRASQVRFLRELASEPLDTITDLQTMFLDHYLDRIYEEASRSEGKDSSYYSPASRSLATKFILAENLLHGEARDAIAASMIGKATRLRSGLPSNDSPHSSIENLAKILLQKFNSFCEQREYYEAASWIVEQSRQTDPGMMAPTIIAFDTSGEQWTSAQMLGHPLLLYFWRIPEFGETNGALASPAIQTLHELCGDDIRFATIALTCGMSAWKEKIKDLPDGIISLHDPHGLTEWTVASERFDGISQYCLLDGDGRIILPPTSDMDLVEDAVRRSLRKQ